MNRRLNLAVRIAAVALRGPGVVCLSGRRHLRRHQGSTKVSKGTTSCYADLTSTAPAVGDGSTATATGGSLARARSPAHSAADKARAALALTKSDRPLVSIRRKGGLGRAAVPTADGARGRVPCRR
jgi:hypothetical protein